MRVRLYRKPGEVGWLGWLEDLAGNALGYIQSDGRVLWMGNKA